MPDADSSREGAWSSGGLSWTASPAESPGGSNGGLEALAKRFGDLYSPASLEFAFARQAVPSPMWRQDREVLGLFLGVLDERWARRLYVRDSRTHALLAFANCRPAMRSISAATMLGHALPVAADGLLTVPGRIAELGGIIPFAGDYRAVFGVDAALPSHCVPYAGVSSVTGGQCVHASITLITMFLHRYATVTMPLEVTMLSHDLEKEVYCDLAAGPLTPEDAVRVVRRIPGLSAVLERLSDPAQVFPLVVSYLSNRIPLIAFVNAEHLGEAVSGQPPQHAVAVIGWTPRQPKQEPGVIVICPALGPFRWYSASIFAEACLRYSTTGRSCQLVAALPSRLTGSSLSGRLGQMVAPKDVMDGRTGFALETVGEASELLDDRIRNSPTYLIAEGSIPPVRWTEHPVVSLPAPLPSPAIPPVAVALSPGTQGTSSIVWGAITSLGEEPLDRMLIRLVENGVADVELYAFRHRDLLDMSQLLDLRAPQDTIEAGVYIGYPGMISWLEHVLVAVEKATGVRPRIRSIATNQPNISSGDPELQALVIVLIHQLANLARAVGCQCIEIVAGGRGHAVPGGPLRYVPVLRRAALIQALEYMDSALVDPRGERPVYLAIEIEPGQGYLASGPAEVARILRNVEDRMADRVPPRTAPLVGVNLDFGHLECMRLSPADMQSLAPRIIHCHASDHVFGHAVDLPLGSVVEPSRVRSWLDFYLAACRQLSEIPSTGMVSCELEQTRDYAQTLQSIAFLKTVTGQAAG